MRAFLLLLAAACATPQQSASLRGGYEISPGSRSRALSLTDDGFDLSWVGGSAQFHSAAQGCASAQIAFGGRYDQISICPVEPGVWHAAIDQRSMRSGRITKDGFEFQVHSLPDGCLTVSLYGANWTIDLDQGAAAASLRLHPELLGAAAALKLLPLQRANYIELAGIVQ